MTTANARPTTLAFDALITAINALGGTIPTLNVLANTTGGTAAAAGVTVSSLLDAALGNTQGQILYRGASLWTPLAPGTSSQFLKSGGASANPSWGTPSGGSSGTGLTPTAVQTANYTLLAGDYAVGSTAGGAITFTFPTAPPDKTVCAVFHAVQGSTNLLTYVTGGSDVFKRASGPTSLTLGYAGEVAWYQYEATGAIWIPIAETSATMDTGDYVVAALPSGSGVTPTNNVVGNVISISLPAGDWDVSGDVDTGFTGGTITQFGGGTSNTSITFGPQGQNFLLQSNLTSSTGVFYQPVPITRYLLTTTTTIYLIYRILFSAGTISVSGQIRARRYR